MGFGGKLKKPLPLSGWLLACLLLMLFAAFSPEQAKAADSRRAAAGIRHLDAGQPDEFVEMMATLITEGCAKRNLDIDLAVALCYTESNFKVKARNPRTGCAGLYQLAPCHKVDDVYNPVVNVDYGLGILADCLKRSNGEVRPALRRYGANTTRTLKIMSMLKSKLHDAPLISTPAEKRVLFSLAREIDAAGGELVSRAWRGGIPRQSYLHTEDIDVY